MNATHSISNIQIGTIAEDGISFKPIDDGYISDSLQFPDFGTYSHNFTLRMGKVEYYKMHRALYGALPKLPRKLKKKVRN